jgi:phosphoribosyl 1,2-cyclic phosphodiesterase
MIEIMFWGVRGSTPVSGEQFKKIGGHTACVSVQVNDDPLIILDAGSGMYDLGRDLVNEKPGRINVLISHLHLDHLMGFPFFEPLWNLQWEVNIYSHNAFLKNFLKNNLIHAPLFPITPNSKNSHLKFHYFELNKSFKLGKTKISTCSLQHPGGSIGYRLDSQNYSICYISDFEHDPEQLDKNIIDFTRGCDLLIYDSSYTEEEYSVRKGWGHSTHIRAAELAKAAAVKKLALFHQAPSHTDELSDKIEKEAQSIFPESIAAYQGLRIQYV